MNILICDDEPLAIQRLIRLVEKLGYDVVATAENGIQAIEKVRQYEPDVILLDVQMPEMDGLSCAEQLRQIDPSLSIIFCTAYDEHALDAFRLHANGYLLKPVRLDELEQALNHLQHIYKIQRQQLQQQAEQRNSRQHLTIKTHKGIELIAIDDIYYFIADQKYVTVRHQDGQSLIDETLKELEQEFAHKFMRIHRNALIYRHLLNGLEAKDGQYYACLKGVDDKLLISRRHLAEVKDYLNHR